MSHYKTIKALGTPIVVHSNLTRFLGSVTASILLSHVIYWSERTNNALGFYRTLSELKAETALTDNELRSARKLLVNLGLVKETYQRLEHKLYFKFDDDAFDEWFDAQMANSENHKCHLLNPQMPPVKTTDATCENHSSLYTKITTKNTTKNTTDNLYIHDESAQENFQTAKKAKTPKTNSSAKKYLTADDLVSIGVDEQVANDYLATRKTKLTQTALNGIIKQANLANITIGQAIETAAEHGWQSFKAEWLNRQSTYPQAKPNKPNRMAEFAEQASQWGDDFYSRQPSIGESK